MNYTQAQLIAALVLIGAVSSQAEANIDTLPEATKAEVEIMIGAGMITFDPQTLQPILNIDVVKRLKEEGRLKTKTASTGTICTGMGSPAK